MGEQVANRDSQVMVGVHEPHRLGDDPVPVGIGVVAEGEVEAVLELDQAGHRIGARAVHANLAVVVERHEPERRIDRRVGDGDIQAVTYRRSAASNGRPRRPSGSTPSLRPAARIASMSMTFARSST